MSATRFGRWLSGLATSRPWLVIALRERQDLVRADTYATTHDPSMIATDGRRTYVVAQFRHINEQQVIHDLRRDLEASPSLRVFFNDAAPTEIYTDVSEVSVKD